MADNWILPQEIDLQRSIQAPQVWPDALIVCGDNKAHTWRVTIMDDGKPAALSGTVTGYFIRGDNATVVVTGKLTGNVATVTLTQSCYNVEGDMTAVMRLKTSDGLLTLAALVLPVRRMITDAIVDPEHIIPSLEDLLAQIERMEAGTEAAVNAAGSANTAAASANASASAADAAAADAGAAATSANAGAVTANAAASAANTAAAGANASAEAANQAAGRVDAAIAAATDAATAATEAAAGAETSAQAANASAALANSSASAADAATARASASADSADAAAAGAVSAESAAQTAAAYIRNTTCSAVKLPPGSTPTAVPSEVDGHLHLTYGLVPGDKGDQGAPFLIKGAAYPTLAALQADITAPDVGDQYNVGAAAPYSIYRWTGSAWENQGILQGPAGDEGATFTPNVSADGILSWENDKGLPNPESQNIKGPQGPTLTVCSVEPDANGNVLLTGAAIPVSPENETPVADALTGKQPMISADNAEAVRTAMGLQSGALREVQRGIATVAASANATASVNVTFLTPFSAVPAVVATLASPSPESRSVGVYNITQTDMKLYLSNGTSYTGNLNVRWIAVL